jgi:uncharacterized membrane protein YedE/YeeE
MKSLAALFCGTLFGIGLAVSGMTDTAKVLGFLDLFGDWIPDLAFVMGGAVFVTLIAFRFIIKRDRALLGDVMSLPGNKAIDGRLLAGAAIFGVGWGTYGYCPGPAISALGYLDLKTVYFVVAMLIGMALANRMEKA